jgi:hypothetical protein
MCVAAFLRQAHTSKEEPISERRRARIGAIRVGEAINALCSGGALCALRGPR